MIDHARTIAALHRNAFTFCFGSSFFVFFFRVRRLSSIVTDLLYWTGCNASLTAPAAFVFRFSLQHRLSREKKKKYQSPTRLIPIDRFDSIQTPERMNRCFFLLFLLFVYIKFSVIKHGGLSARKCRERVGRGWLSFFSLVERRKTKERWILFLFFLPETSF